MQVNYLVLERRPRIWLFEILDDEVGLIYPQIGFEEKSHWMMIKDEEFNFELRVIEL